MEGWADFLRVVPQYDFIVTVVAIAMTLHWFLAKLRQWRMESIIQKLWERRSRNIRVEKARRGLRDRRVEESKPQGI